MDTKELLWIGSRAAWKIKDLRGPEAYMISLKDYEPSERQEVERAFAQGQLPEASVAHFFDNHASLSYLYQEFQPREDDVYICTYGKSGTTLTQQIIYQLLFGPCDDYEDITKESPWLETRMDHQLLKENPERYPRILKSHMRFEHFPVTATTDPSTQGQRGKFILIERDMKDTFASFYRHVCGFGGPSVSETALATSFVNGTMSLGPYDGYTLGWRNEAPNHLGDRLLRLQFEDMRSDLKGAIAKIAQFLGARCDDEHLEQVYQRCTLDYMGAPEHKSKFNHDWERQTFQQLLWESSGRTTEAPATIDPNFQFVGQGKSGSHRTLSPSTIELLDEFARLHDL